jgi:hypothetical protein
MFFKSNKISTKNQVNIVEKIKHDDNLNRSRFPLPLKKSAYEVLFLAVTIFLLTGLVVVSSGCSPVSLHLKLGAFEYQLQKGSCNIPQLPPQ